MLVRRVRIPDITELAHGQTRSFRCPSQTDDAPEGFVLSYRGALLAYLNRCPHWNVDLDLGDGRFYDASIDRIYCKNHGATFLPTTGVCDRGPCRGQALRRLPLEVTDGEAIVSLYEAISR